MADGDDKVVSFEERKAALKERIERAGKEVEDALDDQLALKEMNEKHAFIHSVGGKPMVLSQVWSEAHNRFITECVSPDAIKVRYCNASVQVNKKYVEKGQWWLKHAGRREYKSIMFDPCKPKECDGLYNLWQGFAVEPKKGNWKLVLRHLYKILCNGERDKFEYTIKWIAWLLQNPGTRSEVAIIFKGKEGAGKGFIFTQLLKIFAQHGIAISNREHLTGKFNGHLQECCFLFADEAYYPGDKAVEGCLKQLITEEHIPIEGKHIKLAFSKNCLHIAMSTNQEWIIPAHEDSRRYFVNEVDNRWAKNETSDAARAAYFKALWDCMDSGGREAMLHDLLNMKLGDWHPRTYVPNTGEMAKQRLLNLSFTERFLLEFLDEGSFPGIKDEYGNYKVPYKKLNDAMDAANPNKMKVSAQKKAQLLKKVGAIRTRDSKTRYWVFSDLHQSRKKWEDAFGRYEWPDSDDWQLVNTAF